VWVTKEEESITERSSEDNDRADFGFSSILNIYNVIGFRKKGPSAFVQLVAHSPGILAHLVVILVQC